jgi:hypothetical protein
METKHQPLSHPRVFRQRVLTELIKAGMILTGSLIMGILGYHYFANLDWIDSVYNASMILGGMGPVNEIQGMSAKLFASFYAIFSGIILIGLFGLVITPVLHRIMHRLHLEN